MNPTSLKAGTVVLCRNHLGCEDVIKRGYFYTITRVSHEGLVVYLDGIEGPFAPDRFEAIDKQPINVRRDTHARN